MVLKPGSNLRKVKLTSGIFSGSSQPSFRQYKEAKNRELLDYSSQGMNIEQVRQNRGLVSQSLEITKREHDEISLKNFLRAS